MVREQTLQLIVETEGVGVRLDLWLARQLPHYSRSKIQKLITQQAVQVNGRPCRAKDLLVVGDQVQVTDSGPPPMTLPPLPMALDIIYEDEDLIVVNKPSGLAVHPGAGSHEATLVQGLLHHAGTLSLLDPEKAWQRPGIVHRLDKDTTGVMVCAKTELAHRQLAAQFQAKTNTRHYWALLDGLMPAPVVSYESYLYRDPQQRLRFASLPAAELAERFPDGKPPKNYRWAKTTIEGLASYGHRLTLARLKLFTGRTHQIRVHCGALGCPVWGDSLYNRYRELPQTFSPAVRQQLYGIKRQLLHAHSLGFVHPRTGQAVYFEAPLPQDFEGILRDLGPYQNTAL